MFLESLIKPSYPHVAVEISQNCMAGVLLEPERDSYSLKKYFVEVIPEGVLEISMMRPNILDFSRMQEILKDGLERLGGGIDTLSLVLSDRLAKVNIITLENFSLSQKELLELLRWKLKKSTPFRVEAAHIGYQVFSSMDGGGGAVLVALIQDSVLKQYEELFLSLKIHPGLVDFSSFNVYNLFCEEIVSQLEPEDNFMIVNCCDTYFTIMIFRGSSPIFYRCKNWITEGDIDSETSFCDQLKSELKPSLLYYHDRLKGGPIARVYFRIVPGLATGLLSILQHEFPGSIEVMDPLRVLKMHADDEGPGVEDLQILSPSIGAGFGR
jgi:Tfp pilus assembly PilM family ATPase